MRGLRAPSESATGREVHAVAAVVGAARLDCCDMYVSRRLFPAITIAKVLLRASRWSLA